MGSPSTAWLLGAAKWGGGAHARSGCRVLPCGGPSLCAGEIRTNTAVARRRVLSWDMYVDRRVPVCVRGVLESAGQ